MKTQIKLILIAILAIPLFSFLNPDEQQGDITQQVAAAIRSGNSSELANYFNTTIDLTMPTNEGSYSKTQAEAIVKVFFQKNAPQSFTINNQGTSKGGMRFAIGTLTTRTGTFRVYYIMKELSGQTYVQQLQIQTQ